MAFDKIRTANKKWKREHRRSFIRKHLKKREFELERAERARLKKEHEEAEEKRKEVAATTTEADKKDPAVAA